MNCINCKILNDKKIELHELIDVQTSQIEKLYQEIEDYKTLVNNLRNELNDTPIKYRKYKGEDEQ